MQDHHGKRVSRWLALVFLGLCACGGKFVVAEADDAAVDGGPADALADTPRDTAVDVSVGDAGPPDVSPEDASRDEGVADVMVPQDIDLGPCEVDERVQSNRCVPCSGGEGRAAGDDPMGPDTECAADDCTHIFGLSCSRFEDAYLKGSPPRTLALFGASVALSGDTLVVGAPGDSDAGRGVNPAPAGDTAMDAGAVYVFRRSDEGWQEEAFVKASNADAGDSFGYSVAVEGDTLVVGAPYESSDYADDPDNNDEYAAGAVYIFRRLPSGAGPVWVEDAYLKGQAPVIDYEFFGWDVAISDNTVAVGTPGEGRGGRGSGSINIFVLEGAVWRREALIQASNTEIRDGLGAAVALDGDTLVAGAIYEDGPGNASRDSGAAYVFRRGGGMWQEEAYLRASNAEPDDRFGGTVAIDGDTIVVAALGEDSAGSEGDNSAEDAGAVYVFARSGMEWSQTAYLKPTVTQASDAFGTALSLQGGTLAIGAYHEDGTTPGVNTPDDNGTVDVGAAYLFLQEDLLWVQSAYIHASNAGASDLFGFALSLDGPYLAIGAFREDGSVGGVNGNQNDDLSRDSGAVYVRRIAP